MPKERKEAPAENNNKAKPGQLNLNKIYPSIWP
jgi:hypothetical protein